MAKHKPQPRRAPKPARLYAGKTRGEWRDLGEEIGKNLEKGRRTGRSLGEKVDVAADRVFDRIKSEFQERRNKREWREFGKEFGREVSREWEDRWETGWNSWWFNTFGLIGPIIGSVFGIIWLIICIWIINFLNIFLALGFLTAVTAFLWANLGLFFAASLFFGYGDYFVKRFPGGRWLVQPALVAMGITFALWVFMRIAEVIYATTPIQALAMMSGFLEANLQAVFVLILVIAYVVSITRKLIVELRR